jgi:YVTN family beta-propeller protein
MGEMFVANYSDDTVSVISDSTNTVAATIKVGTWPTRMAYDSSQGEVYVVSNVGGSISVVSDKTNSVVTTVTGLADSPNDIAYDSGKNELFVAESNNSGSGAVDIISDSSNTVVATVVTNEGCTGIIYDAAKGEVFTVNGNQNMYAISDSNHDIATIPLSSYPGQIAYDPAKGEIFASLPVGETLTSGFSVISDSNNTVTKTITTSHPGYFAYNAAKDEMYTETANNTVSVITDSGTGKVVASLTLPTGESIGIMTYDTNTGKLFIINATSGGYPPDNTVSVVTPAS